MTKSQIEKMREVLEQVAIERQAQHAKWGEQDHPDVLHSEYGTCLAHGIIQADLARIACDSAAQRGACTYAHILIEETAEAIEAAGSAIDLRAELVQVAAVAVAWIEAIDRRGFEVRA